MATFVLVPGGWGGAWWYREPAAELRRRGHQAHPVPLTGVGERAAQLTASVNLDTHIQDVVALIEAEQIADAVLVGHSYGGMVITGVAEALPGRIRRLIYSDAYVPGDGDSCTSGCARTRPSTSTRCPSATTFSPTHLRSGWGSCWQARNEGARTGSVIAL